MGEHLRAARQRAHDPHSPAAFDVCTAEEARSTDAREAEEVAPARPADQAREVAARGEGPAPEGAKSAPKAGAGRGKKG